MSRLLLLVLSFLALTASVANAYVALRPPHISSHSHATGKGSAAAAYRSPSTIHIKNYRPLPPSDNDPLDVRCALLHISARKALKSGKVEVARK